MTSSAQSGAPARTFIYDDLARVTQEVNPESGTTTYAYDTQNAGDLYTRTRPAQNGASGTVVTTYTHDGLHRLTNVSYADGGVTPATGFSYDESNVSGTSITNGKGRLTHSSTIGTAATILSYDVMGRVLKDYQCTPLNCGTGSFGLLPTYDNLGDMLSLTDPDTYSNTSGPRTYTYTYNAAAIAGGVTRDFLYDLAGHIYQEVDGTVAAKTDLYTPGGLHLGSYADGTTYFSHANWLGTELVRTGPTGSVLRNCTGSLPFQDGENCTGNKGSYVNGISGLWLDDESGLTHTIFRDYSSTQGRWLTPDPAGLAAVDPGDPQTWNRYAYVMNNPLSFTDPTGLDCVYLNDDETVNHLTVGDCSSPTDDGYYVNGTIVGGANGINNSNYGTAGPDGTLNFYVQGQTDPTSLCVAADCTGNIGGVTEDPNANLPTSGSVVIAAPFDQAVSVLGQSGITPSPADKLNFFHPGKSHFRDSHAYCGVHVLLDATSGQNGQPTTGSFHVDEFNPNAIVNVWNVPVPFAPAHVFNDFLPDFLYDATGHSVMTPGRDSCGG